MTDRRAAPPMRTEQPGGGPLISKSGNFNQPAEQGRVGYAASIQIDYTVQVWQGEGQFIAHAVPLDVAIKKTGGGWREERRPSAIQKSV
jgi:hypothetical protein